MVLRRPKKRVVQTVVYLPPFTMESRIPMVLIQLDTVGSLEFLRGTQLLSGSPALTAGFYRFPTRCVGSKMALLPSCCRIKLAQVHRISQSRVSYRFVTESPEMSDNVLLASVSLNLLWRASCLKHLTAIAI